MSATIILTKVTAQDALLYKQQLVNDGLVLNQDYTWRYQPVKYNNDWSTQPIEQSQVAFEFKDETLASFYRIKWAK